MYTAPPEYALKEEAKPEQDDVPHNMPLAIIIAPEEAKPAEVKPEEVTPEEVKPEEVKSGQTKPKAPTPTPEGNKIPTNKE